ncbi:hypothetical protein AB0H43_16410 [Hamadaea sp. NPDC050747]|uniref:hypothetical protein n=1 Tax=Hamadaea sp. NPDC050747 TaxID=3155789 RepID=UPI00340FE69E
MVQTILLGFLAGVFGANGVPHFVRGITKSTYPSMFGYGPVVNLLSGWAMFVLAGVVAYAAHVADHPVAAFTAAAAGVLLMGLFHAGVGAFGRRPPADVSSSTGR